MLDPTVSSATDLQLRDGLGRRFEYLRLSITEVCNFRCTYCLPHGYRRRGARQDELSIPEIERAVRAFAALGMWKVRLTGGEPTVRTDFDQIARVVAGISGVRRVAMTTNGWRLADNVEAWRDAGIDAINVSIDTLNPARFAEITGHDRLASIIAGVDAALAAGFASVKMNAVLMRGVNDHELEAMLAFVARRDIALRFIEVMRTNDNPDFFAKHHVAAHTITDRLEAAGWQPVARKAGGGPAIEYAHGGSLGRIGVIAPYSSGFCETCNRLRLSADGRLHLCLFGDGGLDLRPLLQRDGQHDELVERIASLTVTKAPSHRLHEANSGATPHLASIGG